jgi:DNA-binding MarR family transcriptional regulator
MNTKLLESIGKWISYIYRRGQIYVGEELQTYNIGSGQYPVLLVLSSKDDLSQQEISNILNVDKATGGRAIRRLVDAGYVKRKQNPEDGRVYNVFLTEKGREIVPIIRKILSQWTGVLLSNFTREEEELVMQLLEKMYQNALRGK